MADDKSGFGKPEFVPMFGSPGQAFRNVRVLFRRQKHRLCRFRWGFTEHARKGFCRSEIGFTD
jgi:hypothetical protein